MRFAHPQAFVLIPIAIVAVLAVLRGSARRVRAIALRHAHLPFAIAALDAPRWPEYLFAAAWGAVAVAIALAVSGPSIILSVPAPSARVIVAIDTSGSMAARDLHPSRAAAASEAVRMVARHASGGVAIGIVTFAASAQALLPPTRDRDALETALNAIPSPNGPTAIGDALDLGRRLLGSHGRRAIILITDGENNRGVDPESAVERLRAAGVQLETVGIGTTAGAAMPGTTLDAGFDEAALRAYAARTGGTYASGADSARLDAALAALARTATRELRPFPLGFDLTLGAALGALLIWWLGTVLGRY